MALDDSRQRLQRDLEDAYRRGQLDETVRTVQTRLAEINNAVKDIQSTMSQLSQGTVTREEFESLEVKVQTLTKWQWTVAGAISALLALTQILPRVIDFLKKA